MNQIKIIIMYVLFVSCFAYSVNAQLRPGSFGLNAGIAMPAGITQSAGIPTSATSQINFTYSSSTNLIYVLNNNFQLEGGIGFLSASYTVPSGTAPASQSLMSLAIGGKYFLSTGDVMPYLGVGLSYSSLPKTQLSQNVELTGSLMTFLAAFGAQAYLNTNKTFSVYIQMGLGYNKATSTSTSSGMSSESGQANINLGGSAIGGAIYF